ncbi:SulP family inorganic anion transporter [Roseisolibacter sp. H3M3-2]|uniref:SulP family inorganic anion transporter n=1 Tax=Roseisolibacter sp. H3M3-2 TaxID=3031323 RepID=UPI0023D9BA84|nr:SulP family inorganic anion transporter [Roseisolibacter sp. H3M3-2]MDF1501366.1 SulP family inorganic anion transporter [Roseisolibacter sp. H3M3-2]
MPASLVVFLVALPLCLGVALASGAPLLSGIVAGVVGGLVVAFASGAPLMVSGPAAGLTAIVFAGVQQVGGFTRLLPAVVLAGALQLVLGAARAGLVGYYIPSAVIQGMLAAIGLILILKQIPHAVGYDADYVGDFSYLERDGETTFSALAQAFQQVQPGAVAAALVGLAVLILWPRTPLARVRLIPAPLAVVAAGVGLNTLLQAIRPAWAIRETHLVALPTGGGPAGVVAQLPRPDWSALGDPAVWTLAATIGIVASLESLLSLEATNKLDPLKREAPANRELLAQGLGNVCSGLLGGLPVTGVIVRSSANIDAGGRTRLSSVLHGVLLLVAVLALGPVLNRIPLAALAAILCFTGYKLAHPALWRAAWRVGPGHFVPFAATVAAILFTDLLVGIGIGLVVGLTFILVQHLRQPAFTQVSPPGAVLTRYALPDHVTFLSKAGIARALDALAPGSRVEIDGRRTKRFDYDALEALLDFRPTARARGIDYRLVGVPEVETTPAH